MSGGIKLAPLLTEIKVNIDQFKSDMDKASSIGVSGAKRISDQMKDVTKAGESLSKVGKNLTTHVTLPLIAAGTASAKMAMDFESDFAKVSTLLEGSAQDYALYKDSIIKGSTDMKTSVRDYSDAVYQAISASVDQKDAVQFTNDAIKLAKGGFTSAANSVDILTTAINGYNLSADDATRISDLLITTQNKGKTTVDELAGSMGKVIPVASQANFGIEELSTSYAVLTKNGIQTAEAGTYIKAMLSEITKSGSATDTMLRELTGKGFAELKSEGMATTDILKMLSDAAEADGKTLKDMFSSVEAGSGALVLAKNNGEEYNQILNDMKYSAGATQEAFEKIDATPAERLAGSINKMKNAGIELGQSFIPIIEKVSDRISGLADWFSGLDESQQENIITWGVMLAGIGPVFQLIGGGITNFVKLKSAIGGVSEAIGKTGGAAGLLGSLSGISGIAGPVALGIAGIATAAYSYHEYGQMMNRSVIESKEEMSLMERALAYLNGTEAKSREELEALGLVYKDFGENISPEFQRAVEDATNKVNDFSIFLNEINLNGVLDQSEIEEFDYRVESMCNSAIETINSKKEETTKSLSELFMADSETLSESEQILIDFFNRTYDNSISEIDRIEQDICNIKQEAIDERGYLNEKERAQIEEHWKEISRIELEALGSTQEEIMYAKNEFSARVATIDAESASQLLQQKAAQIDEEIIQIQAGYDTKIQMLQEALSSEDEAVRSAAAEQIAQLEADKETKIQNQRDLYDEYLAIIEEKNPEILSAIDKGSGQILTNEGVANKKRIDNLSITYDGLEKVTESGTYELYNKITQSNQKVAIAVDQKTGEIVGYWDSSKGRIVAITDEAANTVEQMRDRQVKSLGDVEDAVDGYTDKQGQVQSASEAMSGSLNRVSDAADGTSSSITDLNGNPIEIKDNSNEAVTRLNNVTDSVNNIPPVKNVLINIVRNIAESVSGWFDYNGLDYVPYDGYTATLHKGERVLTAEENKTYSSGRNADIDYDRIEQSMIKAVSQLSIKYDEREVARVVREVG